MINQVNRQKLLAIISLCAFTISQPLFDIISQNPEFLAVRYMTGLDVVVYTAVIALLPPLLLGTLVMVVDKYIFTKSSLIFHLSFSLLLFLLFFMILINLFYVFDTLRIIVAIILVLVTNFAYIKLHAVRSFFSLLSFSIVIFPLYFLFLTPISGVLESKSTYFEKDQYPYGGVKNPKTVVWVVLDELPLITLLNEQKEIDGKNFKNIARFLESATWYKNATTVSNMTVKIMPSMLTGNYPYYKKNKLKRTVHDWLELPIYLDYPDNIFTLLSSSHSLNVKESASSLCPFPLCKNEFRLHRDDNNMEILITDSFYVYLHLLRFKVLTKHLPNIQMDWGGFDNSHINADKKNIFQNFVQSIKNNDTKPQLIFLHSILPHMPWVYTETGGSNGYSAMPPETPPGWSKEKWTSDIDILSKAYKLHFQQMKYVDVLLGELFAKLKEKNLYEDSMIIVVADHGFTMQPGLKSREILPATIVDIMNVPFFIHYPGQKQAQIDYRYTQLIDIMPTISDVLDIERDFDYQGQSLLDNKLRSGKSLRMYSESNWSEYLNIDYTSLSLDESIKRKFLYLK